MYAFGPLPKYRKSGRVIGTHQKINRVAKRHLKPYLRNDLPFPTIADILHFEGSRGPDGVKLKSPGIDEPWHFIDPHLMKQDDQLIEQIRNHQYNLTAALKSKNMVRAAFEAAWLAHAVTDGLTPAHHDPLDVQLIAIRPESIHKHKVRGKVIMSGGGSKRKFVENNWKYWGAKGIMTTHTLFEAGVATAAKPRAFADAQLTTSDLDRLKKDGFVSMYMEMIRQIADLNMYESFKRRGWTHDLALQTTRQLLPTIIRAVTLAWLESYQRTETKQ